MAWFQQLAASSRSRSGSLALTQVLNRFAENLLPLRPFCFGGINHRLPLLFRMVRSAPCSMNSGMALSSTVVTRTPNCTERKNRSLKSADGRVATVVTWHGEKPCPMKKRKNPLDSDRPSHGRRFGSFILVPATDPARTSRNFLTAFGISSSGVLP
jgi:hypothetical protein